MIAATAPASSSGAVRAAAASALTAAFLIAVGSCLSGDLLFTLGLPVTVAGFVVTGRAIQKIDDPRTVAFRATAAGWVSAMAAVGVLTVLPFSAGWYQLAIRVHAVCGIVLAGIYGGGDKVWRRRAALLALASATIVHVAAIPGTRHPHIDVVTWTETTVSALLHGVHPYTVLAPDIYNGGENFGYVPAVYPYLPLTVLIYAPFVAVGADFRLALAACVPATILLMRAAGRRLDIDGDLVDAATLAIAFHPRAMFLTSFGWTEPLMGVAAAAFVYFAVRRPRGFGQAFSFMLLPALKQYFVAPVLLYLAVRPSRVKWTTVAAAGACAAATVVPFLIWNWTATRHGIVFQVAAQSEPRRSADSLIALTTVFGFYPPRWVSVVAQFLAVAAAYPRVRSHGSGGLLLASAFSLIATFLFGWQAFVNYYYLVMILLLLAAITLAARRETV